MVAAQEQDAATPDSLINTEHSDEDKQSVATPTSMAFEPNATIADAAVIMTSEKDPIFKSKQVEATEAFLTLFRGHEGPVEQRKLLKKLFASLTNHQHRELAKWIEEKNTRYDIFGNVPPEIGHNIASHLQLHELISLRRVSPQWTAFLESPEAVEHAFRYWYMGAKAAMDLPDGLSVRAASSYRAQHIAAFRDGEAADMSVFPNVPPKNVTPANSISYSNGNLAWVSKDRLQASLLAVETGKETLYFPNKHRISFLGLSSTMMASISNVAKCRVKTLSDWLTHDFSLSAPTAVHSLTVGQKILAVLHEPSSNQKSRMPLLVWLLKTQGSCNVFHDLQHKYDQHSDVKVMVMFGKLDLVIFERSTRDSMVYCTRRDRRGEVLSHHQLKIEPLNGYTLHSEGAVPMETCPREAFAKGTLHGNAHVNATIWSYLKFTRQHGKIIAEIVRVQFKPELDELCVVRDYVDCPKRGPREFSDIFFWNDAAYCRAGLDATLYVMNFQDHTIKVAAMGLRTETLVKGRETMMMSRFLGDQRFLINASGGGFLIWCFDKKNKMSAKDPEYRRRLRDAIKCSKKPVNDD